MNLKSKKRKIDLSSLFDEFLPFFRSITGPNIRKPMEIIGTYMSLEIKGILSSTKFLKWNIPKEWNFKKAILKGPYNKKIIDFKDHNIHLVNFSEPFEGYMELDDLQKYLYSLPTQTDAI